MCPNIERPIWNPGRKLQAILVCKILVADVANPVLRQSGSTYVLHSSPSKLVNRNELIQLSSREILLTDDLCNKIRGEEAQDRVDTIFVVGAV